MSRQQDGHIEMTDTAFLGISLTLLVYFILVMYLMISSGTCGNYIVS